MNESRAFFKEVGNFRSALIILSSAELNSRLNELDQTIRIKETLEAYKEITKIKDQIASKQAAPLNRANEIEIKELSKKLKPLYEKIRKDSCRKWFKKIVRAKADVECDVDKMLENLEKALAGRYPDAHITYLSTLSSAPNISEVLVKKSVSDFFKAMEQAYGPSPCWQKRYSPEHNPHIREVEKVHFGFYQKWQGLLDDMSLKERLKQIPAEIINADDPGQKKRTREVLENALRDGHLSGRDDLLQRLLLGDSEESLLAKLEGDLEKATTEQRDVLLAQKELILLTKTPLEGSAEDLGGRFEQIGRWLQLKEGDLFKADLNTLKALVMPQIARKLVQARSACEETLQVSFLEVRRSGAAVNI